MQKQIKVNYIDIFRKSTSGQKKPYAIYDWLGDARHALNHAAFAGCKRDNPKAISKPVNKREN